MAPPSTFQTLSLAILALIAARLPLPDRHRFAAVCSSFRSAAAVAVTTLPPHLPYLFLYSPSSFFDLSTSRTYSSPIIADDDGDDRLIIGASSNGLILAVTTSHRLQLINPFTRSRFPLPHFLPPSSTSILQLLRLYFKAAVFYRPPSSFAVAMIVDSRLVVLRDSDPSWRFLDSDGGGGDDRVLYYDLAVFKNSVVAMRFDGRVDAWDLRGEGTTARARARVMVGEEMEMCPLELLLVQRYLVVAKKRGGLLLQVWRWVDEGRFRVFRMDLGKGKWVEVAGLGSQVLFLGRYGGVAVDARDFEGLRKNSIYCCHLVGGRWECSVYCLREEENGRRRSQKFYELQGDARAPIWVMPSLVG